MGITVLIVNYKTETMELAAKKILAKRPEWRVIPAESCNGVKSLPNDTIPKVGLKRRSNGSEFAW